MYDNQWGPHGELTIVTRMFVQIGRLTLRWTSVTEKADKRSENSRTPIANCPAWTICKLSKLQVYVKKL